MKRVSTAIQNLLDLIESMHITPAGWLLSFAGVIFVRIFLEIFSNVPFTGNCASDASTVIHYYLYYLADALSLLLLFASFIAGEKIRLLVILGLAGHVLS